MKDRKGKKHSLSDIKDVKPSRADQKVTDFDRTCAKALLDTIVTKSSLVQKVNNAAWAREFMKLRLLDKQDEVRIEQVLEYHNSRFKEDEYLPEIYSASGFRKKFQQIEAAMERNAPALVVLDPKYEPLIADLSGIGWPKDSEKDLREAFTLTVDAFTEFRRKLAQAYVNTPNKDIPHWRLAHWLLTGAMPNSGHVAHDWFIKVFRRVVNWPDWHGNLLKEVPKPGMFDKAFTQWGCELAAEYSDGRMWTKLMGYIYK
jgi:hypothetical protein